MLEWSPEDYRLTKANTHNGTFHGSIKVRRRKDSLQIELVIETNVKDQK